MPDVTLCAAVTKRAEDGPCAREGCGKSLSVHVDMLIGDEYLRPGEVNDCWWLGLPVERCGHEQGEHLRNHCYACFRSSVDTWTGPLDGPAKHEFVPGAVEE